MSGCLAVVRSRRCLPTLLLLVMIAMRMLHALATPAAVYSTSDQAVFATVRITDVPRTGKFGDTVSAHVADPSLPGTVQLFVPSGLLSADWQDAVCWHLQIRVEALRPARNPGVSDRAQRLIEQGVAARATVVRSARNRPCVRQPVLGSVAARLQVQRSLQRALVPGDARAVLVALTTGDKQEMTPPLQRLLLKTGVAHLMAISGLHVGLVAGAVYLIMGWAISGRAAVTADSALVVALVAAVGYLYLAGNGLPVRRAVAMLVLALLLRRARLPVSVLRLLCFTAFAFVLVWPEQRMSAAFVLSFSAVWSLGLAQARSRLAPGANTIGVRAVFDSQLLLTLGGVPVIAAFFGHVSTVAFVANLIVVPVYSLLVIPLALAGAVLCVVMPDVASWLWRIAAYVIEFALQLLSAGSSAVPAAVTTTAIGDGVVLVCMVMIVAGVLLRGWPARALMLLGLPLALVPRTEVPRHGCIDVQMLNVGHGTAVVLAGNAQRWLYDTGPQWRSGADAAQSIVLPFVSAQRRGRIARGVISHSDDDHDGGLDTMRAADVVDQWLGVPGSPCMAGQAWQTAGVRFEILWPVASALRTPISDNNGSCVLRINTGGNAMLLLGDIESAAERELVSIGGLGARLTTMPHHGSRTSSSQQLIDAIGAAVVIASAGQRRGWQLPHPAVTERWRAADTRVLRTSRDGAIAVRVCRGGFDVVTGVASL